MGAGAGAGARARARAGVELGRAAIRHAILRRTRASGKPRRLGEEEREREREACRLRRRCLFGDAYTVSMRRTGSPAAAWG